MQPFMFHSWIQVFVSSFLYQILWQQSWSFRQCVFIKVESCLQFLFLCQRLSCCSWGNSITEWELPWHSQLSQNQWGLGNRRIPYHQGSRQLLTLLCVHSRDFSKWVYRTFYTGFIRLLSQLKLAKVTLLII